MKWSTKIIVSAFVALLFFGMNMESSSAQVNEKLPPAPTEGIPSADLIKGYGEAQMNIENTIQANSYLAAGSSYITYTSGNVVTVGGSTRAFSVVDSIAVRIHLQRWDASRGVWVDVLSLGEAKKSNQQSVSISRGTTTARGQYYRARAVHTVNHKGKVEQSSSFSTYVYVD